MRLLKRKAGTEPGAGPGLLQVADDFPGGNDELFAEIERLTEDNRASRDRETERRLLRLRHIAGIRLLDADGRRPEHPAPEFGKLPDSQGLPNIAREDLTPGLLRAGILRDGCLLVRGLVDRAEAARFAGQIDRSFTERDRHDEGQTAAEGYYEEFEPDARFETVGRPWIKQGGGVLAADSPLLSFEMMEMFRAAALPSLVASYLGEPAMISVHKTTLRKAEPSVPGAWHQDGAFMGEVNALNLWISLSRCGDEAPGLDLVPRRLDDFVRAQTDEALLDYQVSQQKAEEAAGDRSIVRPIFEPGDAVFFDELCLHKTGSEPTMRAPRFAIESWFFGGSAFPEDYAPIAV